MRSIAARPGRPRTRTGLRVGIVSAGRVGSVLGAALAAAGHTVVAASGVSTASVRRAERLLPGVPLRPADEVAAAAELLLLAVPDDILPGLLAGLVETGAVRRDQIVVHTSGAHGLSLLEPAARKGAVTLAIHPAMTLTGRPEDLPRLAGTSFGVTAAEEHRAFAEALVRQIGGEPVWIPDEARPLYHAALVTGANHLVTLVNEAADMLRGAGVAEPGRMLAPLLTAALDNALRSGDAALTGPVSRGDAGTVATHLATLDQHAPESVPAYLAMARRTASRALGSGRLRTVDAGPLLDVLAREATEEIAQ